MEKRWITKEKPDEQLIDDLSKKLNTRNISGHDYHNIALLLIQRGINNLEEAKTFFRPQFIDLHDPFLMKDMSQAVERVNIAVSKKENILIYGDYDVDGTTSVALMYTFFKDIKHNNLDYYVPDRYSEGYGISYKGIDYAFENGVKLIIALDCGIKAVDKIEYAREKGIDFIICDHHLPGDKLPNAVAVLDAKRDDCSYPYKELSGCGVGFKLIQALSKSHNVSDFRQKDYLDFVAISIASDLVPITGENRILAFYGLRKLNMNPRPGIEEILKYAKVERSRKPSSKKKTIFNKELTINDLVFYVGPRINAAGRIESARDSVKLLITSKMEDATSLGNQINTFNTTRRSLDTDITQQALDAIKADENLQKQKCTVLYNENWHKGVLGIVASRLTETYYRPTIVLTKSEDLITGSARSVKDFDIYESINACSHLLENFGGHKYAAGLSLKPEKFDEFQQLFTQKVEENIQEEMLIPEVEIDMPLKLKDISARFFRILRQFEPFGPGNMAPVFLSENVVDGGSGRLLGDKHLKLTIADPSERGDYFSAIAFQQGTHYKPIVNGTPFNITYHIEENEWNGRVSLQLNIKDIKFNS